MVRLCSALCVFAVSGCGLILDFDPPDPILGSLDGSVDTLDASYADAQIDGDGGLLADAAIVDADASDASLDSSSDGDVDAGMRRCEDTTEGYCFRFTSLADSPEVTDWMIQFIWTLPGGSIYRLPDNRDPDGIAVYAPACDVFRRIDARTTECEIAYPDPGMATISAGPYYAYPTYASGPACTSTGCPAYSAGYRMWSSGVEFSTAPADGRVSLESRPTSDGSILLLRIIP
jgi:hypothetical protein